MKKLTDKEIRQSGLETLKQLHSFCLRHGLRYYLAFGTLLGAVRHKGFIPWDDDLDITMPRKDYEYLVAHFNEEATENRELICKENLPGYYLNFVKIVDRNTRVREKKKEIDIGVWVDVFPLDYAIDSEIRYRYLNRKIRLLYKLTTAMYEDKPRVWYKRAAIWILKPVITPVRQWLKKRRSAIAQQIRSNRETKYYGWFHRDYSRYGQPRIPVAWFENASELEFEEERFRVPKEYDRLLHYCYGDYKKLPPKKLRVSHHHFTCYWAEDNT